MPDKLPPKILVVEPDEVLNASLCNNIERYWFDVNRARNAEAALRYCAVDLPHVAIISSQISDQSPIVLATKLRQVKDIKSLPIIFLIEQNEQEERYNLDKGAYCDVLRRPIFPDKLMMKIRGLLRKSKPVLHDKLLHYNDVSMDLSTFKVYRAGKQIHLGPTEFKILQLFMQKPKNVYSRSQIIDYVWGVDREISQRTIDVHVNRIRTLMTLKTDKHQLIKTIRSAGYRLD